jgi:signal transduction histidine kinase
LFDFIKGLVSGDGLSPHGLCLLWRPGLIWTHAISDAIIGLSYFSIPLVLASFVTQRRDVHFSWVFWSFAAFILLCGTTHFMAVWTLWVPSYEAEAGVKVLTAAISLLTACALWPLLPKAVALPSQAQLRAVNRTLVARIAERDQALDALEQANEERARAEAMLRNSQKMEAIGKLTGGLAHDFNNMLAIVVANLERIERHLPNGSTLRDPVTNAIVGAERAASITHKLLAFARQQPLMTKIVSVNDIVHDTLTMSRLTVKNRTRVDLDLDPRLWPVQVDPSHMQSTIVNLLFNARDAIRDSGVITIKTRNVPVGEAPASHRLDPERAYVTLEVTDDGVGIPPDVLPKVFDPFFTTKPLGQGTGLGLSQVLGFVQQSGGDVVLDSELGRGTRVDVYLPSYVDAA